MLRSIDADKSLRHMATEMQNIPRKLLKFQEEICCCYIEAKYYLARPCNIAKRVSFIEAAKYVNQPDMKGKKTWQKTS